MAKYPAGGSWHACAPQLRHLQALPSAKACTGHIPEGTEEGVSCCSIEIHFATGQGQIGFLGGSQALECTERSGHQNVHAADLEEQTIRLQADET